MIDILSVLSVVIIVLSADILLGRYYILDKFRRLRRPIDLFSGSCHFFLRRIYPNLRTAVLEDSLGVISDGHPSQAGHLSVPDMADFKPLSNPQEVSSHCKNSSSIRISPQFLAGV